jgi:hypothetical protein
MRKGTDLSPQGLQLLAGAQTDSGEMNWADADVWTVLLASEFGF